MLFKTFFGHRLAIVAEDLRFHLHIHQLFSVGLVARGDAYVAWPVLLSSSHKLVHFCQKVSQFHL